MRKQFGLAVATLAISMAIVGCSPKAPASSETTLNEVNTETSTPSDPATQPEASITPETSTGPIESAEPEATNEPISSTKPEGTTTPEATQTPETTIKPEATKAPEATKKPVATSKPQPSTKPEATTKPEASVKPTPTPKPEVTPKPEATPTPQPSSSPETSGLSASEVYTKMVEGLEFASQMDVDDTLLQDLYGIDPSILESYCVKMPMLSFSISEVGVFKVKDVKDVATVVAGINKRAENVGQMLYPSLVETFEGRKIITRGNYILFAMDEAADTIAGNFNRLIK